MSLSSPEFNNYVDIEITETEEQTRQKIYRLKDEVETQDFQKYFNENRELLDDFTNKSRSFNLYEKVKIKNCLILAKLLLIQGSKKDYYTETEIQDFNDNQTLEMIVATDLPPLFSDFYLDCPPSEPIEPLDEHGNKIGGYFSDRFLRVRIDFLNQPVVKKFVHKNEDGSTQESDYIRVKEYTLRDGSPFLIHPQSFVPLSTLVASEDSLDRLLDLNLTDKDKLVQQASLIADDLQNMSADNLLNKSVDTLLEHFQKIPEAKKGEIGRLIAISFPDKFFARRQELTQILGENSYKKLIDISGYKAIEIRKFDFFKHVQLSELNSKYSHIGEIELFDLEMDQAISLLSNYKYVEKFIDTSLIPTKRKLERYITDNENRLGIFANTSAKSLQGLDADMLRVLNIDGLLKKQDFGYDVYSYLRLSTKMQQVLPADKYQEIYSHCTTLLDNSPYPTFILNQFFSKKDFDKLRDFLNTYQNIAWFLKHTRGLTTFVFSNLKSFSTLKTAIGRTRNVGKEDFELFYFINYMYSDLYLNRDQILRTALSLFSSNKNTNLTKFAGRVYIGLGGAVKDLTKEQVDRLATISPGSESIKYSTLLTQENFEAICDSPRDIPISIYFSMLIAIQRNGGQPAHRLLKSRIQLFNELSPQPVFLDSTLILSHQTGDSRWSVLRSDSDSFNPSEIISLAEESGSEVSSVRFDNNNTVQKMLNRVPTMQGDLTLFIGAHGSPGSFTFGNQTGKFKVENLYTSIKQFFLHAKPKKPKLNLIFTSCFSDENARRLLSKMKSDVDLDKGNGYDIKIFSSSNDKSATSKFSSDSWLVANQRSQNPDQSPFSFYDLFSIIEPRGYISPLHYDRDPRARTNSNFTLFTLDGEQF